MRGVTRHVDRGNLLLPLDDDGDTTTTVASLGASLGGVRAIAVIDVVGGTIGEVSKGVETNTRGGDRGGGGVNGIEGSASGDDGTDEATKRGVFTDGTAGGEGAIIVTSATTAGAGVAAGTGDTGMGSVKIRREARFALFGEAEPASIRGSTEVGGNLTCATIGDVEAEEEERGVANVRVEDDDADFDLITFA